LHVCKSAQRRGARTGMFSIVSLLRIGFCLARLVARLASYEMKGKSPTPTRPRPCSRCVCVLFAHAPARARAYASVCVCLRVHVACNVTLTENYACGEQVAEVLGSVGAGNILAGVMDSAKHALKPKQLTVGAGSGLCPPCRALVQCSNCRAMLVGPARLGCIQTVSRVSANM